MSKGNFHLYILIHHWTQETARRTNSNIIEGVEFPTLSNRRQLGQGSSKITHNLKLTSRHTDTPTLPQESIHFPQNTYLTVRELPF